MIASSNFRSLGPSELEAEIAAHKITDQVLEEMTAWMNRPLDEGRFLVNVANHRRAC
jgi:hypothetical protein